MKDIIEFSCSFVFSIIIVLYVNGYGERTKIKIGTMRGGKYKKNTPMRRAMWCIFLLIVGIMTVFINELFCAGIIFAGVIYFFLIDFSFLWVVSFSLEKTKDVDSLKVWYRKREIKLDYHKDEQGKFVWDDPINTQECISFANNEKMNKNIIPYKIINAVNDYLYKHDLLSDEML